RFSLWKSFDSTALTARSSSRALILTRMMRSALKRCVDATARNSARMANDVRRTPRRLHDAPALPDAVAALESTGGSSPPRAGAYCIAACRKQVVVRNSRYQNFGGVTGILLARQHQALIEDADVKINII